MKLITEITNQYKQKFVLVTEDNQNVNFELNYSDQQQGWFFDLSIGDFQLNGQRLCIHPNILRQFRRILTFGLACSSEGKIEPYFRDDMANGRVNLILLNQDDIVEVENRISNL
jgi:hypothetical protein